VSLCAEEPFRIFFPLGLLFGIGGVSLWPAFFAGWMSTYPAIAHARLMIEGMMSCFIFGFLGTAGPRVMSVPHFRDGEVLRLLIAIVAAMAAHLLALHALADSLFVLALLSFAISLARRFRTRENSPPPNFALVGLGMLNGIVGAALIAYAEWTSSVPGIYRIGSSLLNIGFVLLPLLGVAPFFIRRLLDLPSELEAEANARLQLAAAIVVGLTIDVSFVIDPGLAWLRAIVAAAYLLWTMPLRGKSSLATALRMALVALPAGLGLVALLPGYRITALHVVFIGGFSLAVFAVATRVVLGHSGKLDQLQRRRWVMPVVIILLILAMTARFSADFVPTRNEHLVSAAITWLIAALLWAAFVLPRVTETEPE
jgi:uncharacterized protein involved in response to NO